MSESRDDHPAAPPVVSVIICTRNHCDYLRNTLRAIVRLAGECPWPAELIVVDNGSTDRTEQVVREHALVEVPTRYVREDRAGLSHARNTGMAVARAGVLLWTDDDIRPPANWISGMCTPILGDRADAVAGGVRLAPHLVRDWMRVEHRSWLAETGRLDPAMPRDMVGANMAFSRKVLARVPAFDAALGAGALGFGEDTLFAWQVREAGFRIAGALDVCVEHHCDASRLQRSSWLDRARHLGQSMAYVDYHWRHKTIRHPGVYYVAAVTRLQAWRWKWRNTYRSVAGCMERELELVRRVHYLRRYLSECRRPRQYALRGLVKRGLVENISQCAANDCVRNCVGA